jgi:hypothetical protein
MLLRIHVGLLLTLFAVGAWADIRLKTLNVGLGMSVDAYDQADKGRPEDEVSALFSIKARADVGETFAAALEGAGACCGNDWFNLKQLHGSYSSQNMRLLVGYDVLSWGKTTLYSPVNSINAIDYREDITGQQKRGQFIVSAKAADLLGGTAELVLVPENQEDELPEFTTGMPLRMVKAETDASSGGAALRYSKNINGFHMGISAHEMVAHQRQVLGMQLTPAGVALLTSQPRARFVGFELQKDLSSALIFSADLAAGRHQVLRSAPKKDFHAYSLGLDYSMPFAFSDEHLANLVLEKHYDSRDSLAPSFYQDDWYLGLTYALNDVANTLFRAGVIKDMVYRTEIYTASLSRQFLEGRAMLTLRYFAVQGEDPMDKLYLFKEFNGTRLELMYVF